MSENELFDQYESQLDRVWLVLIDYLQKLSLPVLTAIEEQGSRTDEIDGLFAAWHDLQDAKSEKDKARRLWLKSESHPESISPHATEVLKLDRVVDVALEAHSIDVPVNVGDRRCPRERSRYN